MIPSFDFVISRAILVTQAKLVMKDRRVVKVQLAPQVPKVLMDQLEYLVTRVPREDSACSERRDLA